MKKKLFDTRYPIMLAAMNKVSTIELAIAASHAGIFPSLSGFNYYQFKDRKMGEMFSYLKDDLKLFNTQTGSNNIMLSIDLIDILEDNFKDLILTRTFSHVEILDQSKILINVKSKDSDLYLKIKDKIDFLNSNEIIPIFKCLQPLDWIAKTEEVKDLFKVVILKSYDAAGTVKRDNRLPLIDEFKLLKRHYPDTLFVPTGGISTGKQIREFIDAGAEIVGIGSYFITASESIVSEETKKKIINSNANNISNTNNLNQNAIVFSNLTSYDINQTHSLICGITDPNAGHIFMSKSVDNIIAIEPIKELVNNLVLDL